ncbi:hypothetical protein EV421DRAFT_1952707 [Armillaria borealis]|uniref:Uncharacterized protein n=1 Tax=Armillaria borealis TaxID=47425 RepID=A0AA39JK61_9AGAR|nr:hypothetical protein EV421DRAFT_1952707 [Armillaria borealis]
MAAPPVDTKFSLAPPLYSYITFSIDVVATLKLYCGGGDEAMLQKLDGLQDHKICWLLLGCASFCGFLKLPLKDSLIVEPDEEESVYTVISVRPVQQGLTKPHPRKPQRARPTMCIPVLPTTAHPRSRKPSKVSKGPLPWENCYHPTCYDVWMRVPAEPQDYFQSSSAAGNLSLQLMEAFDEDKLYTQLLRTGLNDDRILRILDGQEEAPDTDIPDDASQTSTDSCDRLEEDRIFVLVMRFDHVLSNVPEISDPSQLFGDMDLFQEIVQEHQLAHFGSAVFPQPEPEVDITPFPDDYSVYSSESAASGTSTEDLDSDSPESHALELSLADESDVSSNPTAPVPPRKGKWRVKSLFRRAITNIIQIIKGHKFSANFMITSSTG